MLAVFNWQEYLQNLRLLCWESAYPNITATWIRACQFDLQLWSTFNNLVSSIGLDHLAFTKETFFLHNQCFKINTMRISVHRVIKLLTLVQDSSMEQKLELFPRAKVVIKV